MTQLENILSRFKDLAYHLKNTGDDTPERQDILSILEKIEQGGITAESLIESHQNQYGFFCGNWHIHDIQRHAKDMDDIDLSDEEAKEISLGIARSHDANIGVNWDVIIDHVREWKEDQK